MATEAPHADDGHSPAALQEGSGKQVLTYAQALDEALCFGWIDGQKNRYDAESWVQNFSPRRARSPWSKINTAHAERLMKEGRMMPAGKAQVDAAREDGRWEAAYDSPGASTIPADFLEALAKSKRAMAFFQTLNRANLTPSLTVSRQPRSRRRAQSA